MKSIKKVWNDIYSKYKVSKHKRKIDIVAIVLICLVVVNIFSPSNSSNKMASMDSDLYMAYSASDSISSGVGSVIDSILPSKSNSTVVPESFDYSSDNETIVAETEESYDTENKATNANTTSENTTEQIDEKLVYKGTINLETKKFNDALKFVRDNIKKYNCIVEDEKITDMSHEYVSSNYYYNTQANIRVRVPKDYYEVFLESLQTNGEVISVSDLSKSVVNFTTQYSDIETKLRSLRVQEERLYSYLERAESVQEMIEIEERLSEVQYEIESYINSRNQIDRDVAYSTVNISLREVRDYTDRSADSPNFFKRVWGYITDSCDSFLDWCEGQLEGIIYLFPYAVLLFIIIFVVRKILKKRKSKKLEKNKTDLGKIPTTIIEKEEENKENK